MCVCSPSCCMPFPLTTYTLSHFNNNQTSSHAETVHFLPSMKVKVLRRLRRAVWTRVAIKLNVILIIIQTISDVFSSVWAVFVHIWALKQWPTVCVCVCLYRLVSSTDSEPSSSSPTALLYKPIDRVTRSTLVLHVSTQLSLTRPQRINQTRITNHSGTASGDAAAEY